MFLILTAYKLIPPRSPRTALKRLRKDSDSAKIMVLFLRDGALFFILLVLLHHTRCCELMAA
jgi:hypothetical protein